MPFPILFFIGLTLLLEIRFNQGRITSTFYPDGSGMTNYYDSLGRFTNTISGFASVTNYYNNQGLLVTVSNAFGRTFSATYDVLDRATNSVDANSVTITSTYDNLNRPLTKSYPDGGQEKFVYTVNIAGVTSYTNQLGSNVVNYAYDALGRKTNEVNPGITTNSFAYDAGGSLTNLTDGKGQITRWKYDVYGRTTNKVDATSTEIFRYQYDADNRLTNRWSAGKGTTTYRYDAVGNLTNVVYPVSPAITMKYDAVSRVTNMVDAVGTTVYGYANQFFASEDGSWDNDTVSYTYSNRLRNSLTLLQPNASSWTQSYGYDSANRFQSLSSPAGGFSYSFKGPGNLATNLALPNGAAITNAFDSVARMTGTWLKNSVGTILNSHAYSNNLAGQRTAMTVAMESTSVYWIALFQKLEAAHLEAVLVNARHVRHVPGRKTDCKDCQWLQRLHSYGLLNVNGSLVLTHSSGCAIVRDMARKLRVGKGVLVLTSLFYFSARG